MRIKIILVMIVSCITISAYTNEPEAIAIFETEVQGQFSQEAINRIESQVYDKMINTYGYSVVSRDITSKILEEIEFQMSGLAEEKNLIKIGSMANAKYGLSKKIFYQNNQIILNVRIADIEKGIYILSKNISGLTIEDILRKIETEFMDKELIEKNSSRVMQLKKIKFNDVLLSSNDLDLDKVMGRSKYILNGDNFINQIKQTNLGYMAADAIRRISGADIGLINGGGIKKSIPKGDITKRNILNTFPFQNRVVLIQIDYSVLKKILENGLKNYPDRFPGFPQVSGMEYTFDPTKPVGDRVTSYKVYGQDVKSDRPLFIGLPDYIYYGGDDYSFLKECLFINDVTSVQDAIARYIYINSEIGIK